MSPMKDRRGKGLPRAKTDIPGLLLTEQDGEVVLETRGAITLDDPALRGLGLKLDAAWSRVFLETVCPGSRR